MVDGLSICQARANKSLSANNSGKQSLALDDTLNNEVWEYL
jgi:hypothetical protein